MGSNNVKKQNREEQEDVTAKKRRTGNCAGSAALTGSALSSASCLTSGERFAWKKERKSGVWRDDCWHKKRGFSRCSAILEESAGKSRHPAICSDQRRNLLREHRLCTNDSNFVPHGSSLNTFHVYDLIIPAKQH